MKTRTEIIIDVQEWDKVVIETYGKPYSFQQQDGCRERGTFYISVPSKYNDDIDREPVPEIVNHAIMGVAFKEWLDRDPKQPLANKEDQNSWSIDMWWDRNFYPDIEMVANDLHTKGLLEAGEYTINIDW